MGHINHHDLREAVQKGVITGVELDMSSEPDFCEACIKGKAQRQSFPKKSETKYTHYGEKIVSDLWGPAQVKSLGGALYSYTNIDLYTHEERITFLPRKSNTFKAYCAYEAWVWVHRGAQIKVYGSDRDGKFTSAEIKAYQDATGTTRDLTVHDSPQSNGVAERANRTIVEGARTMLIAAKLPKNLWAEAKRHMVWLRNRAPCSALPNNVTLIQMATGRKPNISRLCPWGAHAYVRLRKAGKLESKVEEVRFIGIDEQSKGYRVYWPKRHAVTVERDVYFDRNAAVSSDSVQIEGEWDLPVNPDPPQASTPAEVIPKVETNNSTVTSTESTESSPEPSRIDEKSGETPLKLPQNDTSTDSNQLAPKSAPHLCTHRNSLIGLPQFDPTQFG